MLTPCPSCARHVRLTEAACPFCRSLLALAHTPPRATPTQRLGRAAIFTFGAAVASAMGCSQSTTVEGDADGDAVIGALDAAYGGPPNDAGTDAGLVAAYGGPPRDAAAIDAASSDAAVVFDPCADVGVFLMYGGPPHCDSGPARDASTADAVDAWGAALYGAPPGP